MRSTELKGFLAQSTQRSPRKAETRTGNAERYHEFHEWDESEGMKKSLETDYPRGKTTRYSASFILT